MERQEQGVRELPMAPPPVLEEQPKTVQTPPEDTQRVLEGTESRVESDGDYKATVSVRPFSEQWDGDGHWGLGGRIERSIVHDISVTYRGEKVWIWRSAFADLANVNTMRLEAKGVDAVLHLTGGDAHESYKCRLEIKNGELVKRHVEHGEFPEYFYEDTVYTNKEVPEF
jgi:hypothetical protein